ncbi:beta-glucosidase [Lentilactobacillus sp. SPB1-3]|uniref:Beta-glucosidase n=1 Tax=Lentilactobacillus terminaliae TaxID=3003483 RepID=A0ACD5DFJ1_9LACO|nr:glycoside hydrolase family 3 C-terminal domain-containing protein [Lentilactobacillus sp. SPB1-3]MCZ0976439.1 glycoside hydrolase family 3 C-terminal domain-containing protein [Lentilactobacillus sp. SPB1-3]
MELDNSLIDKLTLKEKAALVSGKDFWYTAKIDHSDLPVIMMTDGPSGLRKQVDNPEGLSLNDSVQAVCFPASALTACSFNRQKLNMLGHQLGLAAKAEGISVLLGPGINLKRSPLAGRNFEYFSEDPYLAGELAAAYVKGVQKEHVGVSVKHFAANNRENQRFTVSSNIDERTLREIYLSAFEKVVKKAEPATLMSSYNSINGTPSSQNKWLLTDILRNEWNFKGLVMSDWGAVSDHATAIKAGLDLEMPGKGEESVQEIIDAVQNGNLSEQDLNKSVSRVIKMVEDWHLSGNETKFYDMDKQHEFARELAADSFVLLKNNQSVLPIKPNDKIAIVGQLAANPRYQGSGSSHVNPYHLVTPLDRINQVRTDAVFEPGYSLDDDNIDSEEIGKAVGISKNVDKVIVFAGYPERMESEGFDKDNIDLPANQNKLIQEISKVNKNVIVVLQNGSVVNMPWADNVAAILETYLAGEAVGEATWDVLSGSVNPSGRLAETFPVKLEDNPSFLSFGSDLENENYREGLFIGYRYYDKKKMPVRFPFGFGLSYTTFDYEQLRTGVREDDVQVELLVKNTGKYAGSQSIQVYVGNLTSMVEKPVKTLAGFDKIHLEPGEEKSVTITLDKRAFSWYDTSHKRWQSDNGHYKIFIGESSLDIKQQTTVNIRWNDEDFEPVNSGTYISELMKRPNFDSSMNSLGLQKILAGISDDGPTAKMFKNMPLRAATTMGVTPEQIKELINKLNE